MKRLVIGIPAGERYVVRLFWIGEDISVEALRVLTGANHMDPEEVDIFDVEDLGDGGLYYYMTEGLGISPAQISNADELETLTGTVIFIRAEAFKGFGDNMQMLPPLKFIGEYREPRADTASRLMTSASSKGTLTGKASSGKAMSGKVAMAALAVLFVLVVVMVWIGG